MNENSRLHVLMAAGQKGSAVSKTWRFPYFPSNYRHCFGSVALMLLRYRKLPQKRWMRLQASSRSEVFVA
jgi:hypothetical protein